MKVAIVFEDARFLDSGAEDIIVPTPLEGIGGPVLCCGLRYVVLRLSCD